VLYRINFTLITNYTFIILNWETYIFCKLNLLICSHKGQNSYTARPYSSKRRALRPTSWQDTRSLRRCRRLRDFGSTNPADPANYNACQPRASLIIVVVIVIAVMRLSWVMVSSFFFPSPISPPFGSPCCWQSAKRYVRCLLFVFLSCSTGRVSYQWSKEKEDEAGSEEQGASDDEESSDFVGSRGWVLVSAWQPALI